jgi:hypothetical protein
MAPSLMMYDVRSSSGNFDDVRSSTDGSSWILATAAASWSARYLNTSVMYDDKMWVIGGGNFWFYELRGA